MASGAAVAVVGVVDTVAVVADDDVEEDAEEEEEEEEEDDDDDEEEEAPDEHTASTTKALPEHFVPAGTGFTNAAPLAHWYHQSPQSSRHCIESDGTPAHCTSESAEPDAPLQNSKVPSH